MQFTVQQIDHVEVMVRDIAHSARWYRQVLGLRRKLSWDPEPVMIGAGGTKLALFHAPRARKPLTTSQRRGLSEKPGYRRVAFLSDKTGFLAAQRRLTRLGIPFRGPIDHGGSWSIYFNDPDGLPLEITRLARGSRSSRN